MLGRPGEEIEGQEGGRPECGQCGQCWLQATKRLEVGEGSLAGGRGGKEGKLWKKKKKPLGVSSPGFCELPLPLSPSPQPPLE